MTKYEMVMKNQKELLTTFFCIKQCGFQLMEYSFKDPFVSELIK